MPRRVAAGESGPFLKWAGGKGQLLPHLEPLFPERIETYHEPFLGAGAVFFHLRRRGFAGPAHLSDFNADLIDAFQAVRDLTEDLIAALGAFVDRNDAASYYAERERFNADRTPGVARAARLLYLNRVGFNGLYRVNAKGEFNVPFGRHAHPRILDPRVLRAAAAGLRGTTLEVRDFATVVERARRGDFVYLDPPYDPLSATARFTSYARGGFGAGEQERLAGAFRDLDRAGVKVMLSNHDTPLVRRLYAGYETRVVAHLGRAINSRADRRGDGVAELVVTNYALPPGGPAPASS